MKARTFDDWKAAGYRVRRGERSTGRCTRTGLATFMRDQVEEDDRFDRRANDDAYVPDPRDMNEE